MDQFSRTLPASLKIKRPLPEGRSSRPQSTISTERAATPWAAKPYLKHGKGGRPAPEDGRPCNPNSAPLVAGGDGAASSATEYYACAGMRNVAPEISLDELPGVELRPNIQHREAPRELSMEVAPLRVQRRSLESTSTTPREQTPISDPKIGSFIRHNHFRGYGDGIQSERMSAYNPMESPDHDRRDVVNQARKTPPYAVNTSGTLHPQSSDMTNNCPLNKASSSPQQSTILPHARAALGIQDDCDAESTMVQDSGSVRSQSQLSHGSTTRHSMSTTSVHLDTETHIEAAEIDAFVSPLDFALFTDATSSLGFDMESSATPSFQAQPSIQTQSFPIQPTERTFQESSSLLQLPQSSSTLRSRSVPPQPSQAMHYTASVSGTSSLAPREPTRAQLLLEALHLEEDGMMGLDEGPPDYETSQREASAARNTEAMRRARELEQRWRRGRDERYGWP